jgi:methionyl-tRNA formyltransferase
VSGSAALPAAPTHPRRLVYLGTPQMAVPTLESLVAAGFEVPLVVTRVDKRRGRGSELSPSPVKEAAIRLGLQVSHRVDDAIDVGADLGVVVAFGQLIRTHVLATLPMVNLHFSLLPRWRGAAPVERAILAGDADTGVCVMRVEEGLDTGGIYARTVVPIGARSADDLRRELVSTGTDLLLDTFRSGLGTPAEQVGEVVYAAKIDAAELRIDWSASAEQIGRLVRLGQAWTTFRGRRLKVLEVAGDGSIMLATVQPEGKAPMAAAAWANGARPGSVPSDRLGTR